MTQAAVASVQDRCLTGVALVIKDLALTGQYAGDLRDNVYEQLEPDATNVVYPCVMLEAGEEQEGDGTNSEDDQTVYPVNVLICDRDSKRDAKLKRDYFAWRRAILRKFRQLIDLEGVPECFDVRTRPQAVFAKSEPAYQKVVSSLQLLCHATEPRQQAAREPL